MSNQIRIKPESAPTPLIRIEPQPTLFMNGWGGGLDNSGVNDTTHTVEPVLINVNGVDVWYWKPEPL